MKPYRISDLLSNKYISEKLRTIFILGYETKETEILVNKTPFIENYTKKQQEIETETSNAIENIGEYKYNKDQWKGLNEANKYIVRTFSGPLDKFELLDIHARLMFNQNQAGTLKTQNNGIAGYRTSSTDSVENDVYLILNSYYQDNGDRIDEKIIASIILTLNFLIVHPFQDGNGRMSRLLLHRLLIKSDLSFIKYHSLSQYINNSKKEYYDSLEHVRRGILNNPGIFENENCIPYVLYILDIIIQSIKEFKEQIELYKSIGKNNEQLKEWILNLISKNNDKFKRKDIYKKLNLIMSEDKFKRIIKEMIYTDKTLNTNGHKLKITL